MRSDNSSLARDCRKEIKSLNSARLRLAPYQRAERRNMRGELKQVRIGRDACTGKRAGRRAAGRPKRAVYVLCP